MRDQARFTVSVRGLDEMRKALKAVTRPTFETTNALEGALAATFADTQQRVHRLTGTLARSGQTATTFDGDTWSGEITYGARDYQADRSAYYAIYELARGGRHNFFSGTTRFESRFEEAMDEHFRRTL